MAEAWIQERRALWQRRFDRLGDLLSRHADEPDEDPT
jgi:hypothetical protein